MVGGCCRIHLIGLDETILSEAHKITEIKNIQAIMPANSQVAFRAGHLHF